jgi:hypothetical protein
VGNSIRAVKVKTRSGDELTLRLGLDEAIQIEEALGIESLLDHLKKKGIHSILREAKHLRAVTRIVFARHHSDLVDTDQKACDLFDDIGGDEFGEAMAKAWWGLSEEDYQNIVQAAEEEAKKRRAARAAKKAAGEDPEEVVPPDPPETTAPGVDETS